METTTAIRLPPVLTQYREQFREVQLSLLTGTTVETVLVFRTGCFYRSTLENGFYQVGLVPNQTMEPGTLDGNLSCVAADCRTQSRRQHMR